VSSFSAVTLTGQLTAASGSQPNITYLGTLTSLSVGGAASYSAALPATTTGSGTIVVTGQGGLGIGGNIYSGGNIVATSNVNATNMLVTSNITVGNIAASGDIAVVGNVDSGNVNVSGLVDVVGNIDGGNVNVTGRVVAVGNVSGGNILTGGNVVATGNVSGGNLVTGGVVTATGNITSTANINSVGATIGGEANVNSLRINQAPTSAAVPVTDWVPISINGTIYKLLLSV
jgi:filamentous hemagglutinin